jgi:Site-specific recombinase XerD
MKKLWDENMQRKIDDFIDNNRGLYDENTIDTYLPAIYQYINLVGPMDELSNDNLDLFIQQLREQKNKTKSIRVKIAALKSYIKYQKARKCWYAPSLLRIPLIRDDPYRAVPLTKYDWYQFNQLSQDHLRNACILELFYCTGIRVSELINVRIVDVSLDERQIWIRKGKIKRQDLFLSLTNAESCWRNIFLREPIPVSIYSLQGIRNLLLRGKVFQKLLKIIARKEISTRK